MKKLAAILCLSAFVTGAYAQGFVNILNGAATSLSYNNAGTATITSGAVGSWYGILLTAPVGTTDIRQFTPSTAYLTNLATSGRMFGGNNVAISGWAPGVNRAFAVAAWSSDLGHDFNPLWLSGSFTSPTGYFGASSIATGAAGGTDAQGNPIPNLNVFGLTGISTGWVLQPVPEPTTMALAGLGAAALLIFRRRK